VSIPVISVGMIRTPEQAEELLENGSMDFIGLARPLVADPLWVKKAQEGRSEDIIRCIACQTCKMQQMKNTPGGGTARCALNPRACHEYEYPVAGDKNGGGRVVVVAGAGPGGMTAARELALRGFDVTVLEKSGIPGGQLNLADKPPHKENTSGRPMISTAQRCRRGRSSSSIRRPRRRSSTVTGHTRCSSPPARRRYIREYPAPTAPTSAP
jgi:hypothetical protein